MPLGSFSLERKRANYKQLRGQQWQKLLLLAGAGEQCWRPVQKLPAKLKMPWLTYDPFGPKQDSQQTPDSRSSAALQLESHMENI